MKKILPAILFFVLFLTENETFAFEGFSTVGSRAAGMGGATVTLTDFWSIHNNPAGLANLNRMAAGIAYQNRFQMQELGLKSAGVAIPLNFGVIAASFNQFGYKQYYENKLGLLYSRSFGPSLRMGLQLDYLSSRFSEGYPGSDHLTFEFGVQYDLTSKLSIGTLIFNPISVKRSELTNERIPVVFRFGLSYQITETLLMVGEFDKNSDLEPDARFGLEYRLNDKFYARTGVAVNPGLLSFGAGWNVGAFTLDLAGSLEQMLGSRVQASVVYHFGKDRK